MIMVLCKIFLLFCVCIKNRHKRLESNKVKENNLVLTTYSNQYQDIEALQFHCQYHNKKNTIINTQRIFVTVIDQSLFYILFNPYQSICHGVLCGKHALKHYGGLAWLPHKVSINICQQFIQRYNYQ